MGTLRVVRKGGGLRHKITGGKYHAVGILFIGAVLLKRKGKPGAAAGRLG